MPELGVGDFAYVRRPGEQVLEAEVVAVGDGYTLRKLKDNERITASPDDVWTAPPSKPRIIE